MLTSTVRKDIIINRRFKPFCHEDYIFWAEIIRDNPNLKIKHLNQELAYYNVSDKSLSSKKILTLRWHYYCYLELGYSKFLAFICFIPLILFKTIVLIKR